MQIVQIVFAVLAVACSVSARGYGPGIGGPGGSYGGIGSGIGGRFGSGGGSGGIGGMAGRGYLGAGGLQGAAGSGRYGGVPGAGAGIYGQSMAPKPYSVSYDAPDGQGGVQFKTESGDGSGSVQGTYGYRDSQGLYRVVEYVADQNGYRAAVSTNEPGVDGKENPADVSMNVEKTPAGIQEQYTPVASPFGTGPASGVSGLGLFGRGGPTGGYPGGLGGGIGGPGFGGRGPTGGYPGGLGGGIGGPGFGGRGPTGGYPGGLGGGIGGPGFGGRGPTGGYPGRMGGGIGGSAVGGRGPTGAYGSMGGMSSAPGISGSFGGPSGLFSGIPRSTTGKSAY